MIVYHIMGKRVTGKAKPLAIQLRVNPVRAERYKAAFEKLAESQSPDFNMADFFRWALDKFCDTVLGAPSGGSG